MRSLLANVLGATSRRIDYLCRSYRADPSYLAALRILFALYVLILPVDYSWITSVPSVLFDPAPGPFSLLSGPPSAEFVSVLNVLRIILALMLLFGFRTLEVSVCLSATMVVGSGLANSYGKVDHFILFELTPLALAAAGWGSALSVDAYRSRSKSRRVPRVDPGLPLLAWAMVVAYALVTAALPKVVSGWLDPSREATRGFVARDVADATKLGPLTQAVFEIKFSAFWKFLDYSTLIAESALVVLIFFPLLFRIGIAAIVFFHVGVYLALGISFESYFFVYAPFFSAPVIMAIAALRHTIGPSRGELRRNRSDDSGQRVVANDGR